MRPSPAKRCAGISNEVSKVGHAATDIEKSKARPPSVADLKPRYRMFVLSFTSSPDQPEGGDQSAPAIQVSRLGRCCTAGNVAEPIQERSRDRQCVEYSPRTGPEVFFIEAANRKRSG